MRVSEGSPFRAIAAALGVLLIAGPVLTRWPPGFDRAIILAWHAEPAGGLRRALSDITALGGGTVLTIAVAAAAGLLLVRRRRRGALLLVVATLLGSRVVEATKLLFARDRPDIVDHAVSSTGYSFPSAHAANSATVCLMLVMLLVHGRAARRYMLAVAALLVFAIGISRVALGVHWPSDVLAGWTFGALWALGWVRLIAQRQ